MKLLRLSHLLFALVLLAFAACNDDLNENPVVDPDPITPNLTETVKASVSGFVVDDAGSPVVFATVSGGGVDVLTDEYGFFEISDMPFGKFAGVVKISHDGYFDTYKTFVPQSTPAFVRAALASKSTPATIDAAAGGTAAVEGGAEVTLQPGSVVVASNGTAYTGTVNVYARVVSPSQDENMQLDRPGDARATDLDGYAKVLRSFTTMAVELWGNGQRLQIMEGKTATVKLPVSNALSATAPAEISLWSFDESTGLWKQEGTAVKSGTYYTGTVSHFSYWEGAEGIPLVNFTARIVDAAANPLANVPVSITPAGMPKNAGHGRFAYTDANGFVTGAVFANTSLALDILTPCALSAYEYTFNTAATDVDLGTLTGNVGQSLVTISGTASNCDNNPVASGYVQTYDGGFYNRFPIVNGNFSFSGVMCTNTAVNIVAVDNATLQQSEPETVTLSAGVNTIGALEACGTSTVGYITYTIDGTTVTIQEPADKIGAYYVGSPAFVTQVVTIADPSLPQKMAFQVKGDSDVATAHTVTEVFSTAFPSGRGYWPVAINVTITEFGKIGGFMSGGFSSTMLDFGDNSVHEFSCSFRVRRRN